MMSVKIINNTKIRGVDFEIVLNDKTIGFIDYYNDALNIDIPENNEYNLLGYISHFSYFQKKSSVVEIFDNDILEIKIPLRTKILVFLSLLWIILPFYLDIQPIIRFIISIMIIISLISFDFYSIQKE